MCIKQLTIQKQFNFTFQHYAIILLLFSFSAQRRGDDRPQVIVMHGRVRECAHDDRQQLNPLSLWAFQNGGFF